MTRNCQAPGRKRQTKKPLPHTWDKSRCFCDTTQIDVKNARSLTRTIIRAPVDNGWVPVGPYLAQAVRSALRSPFAGRSPPRSHHRGLSEGLPRRVLLSVTGLVCLVVVVIIRRRAPFVNPFPQEIFTALKRRTHPPPILGAERALTTYFPPFPQSRTDPAPGGLCHRPAPPCR